MPISAPTDPFGRFTAACVKVEATSLGRT